MYKIFYSLTHNAFSKELTEKFFFKSSSFESALEDLNYLSSTRGIGLFFGEPGVGKTSLLRYFVSSLNPSLFKPIYFQLSTLTVNDFYRALVMGLGEEPKFRKIDLFAQIQSAVLSLFSSRKITPIFILDEMHLSSSQFRNDISLLFNFHMDSQNPFVLILLGLSYLKDSLSLASSQSLFQRIIVKRKLNPLSIEETALYIKHLLDISGVSYDIFSQSAIEAIASRSKGFPRIINLIVTDSLQLGYEKQVRHLDENIVKAASIKNGY